MIICQIMSVYKVLYSSMKECNHGFSKCVTLCPIYQSFEKNTIDMLWDYLQTKKQ